MSSRQLSPTPLTRFNGQAQKRKHVSGGCDRRPIADGNALSRLFAVEQPGVNYVDSPLFSELLIERSGNPTGYYGFYVKDRARGCEFLEYSLNHGIYDNAVNLVVLNMLVRIGDIVRGGFEDLARERLGFAGMIPLPANEKLFVVLTAYSDATHMCSPRLSELTQTNGMIIGITEEQRKELAQRAMAHGSGGFIKKSTAHMMIPWPFIFSWTSRKNALDALNEQVASYYPGYSVELRTHRGDQLTAGHESLMKNALKACRQSFITRDNGEQFKHLKFHDQQIRPSSHSWVEVVLVQQ